MLEFRGLTPDVLKSDCPSRRLLGLIADKWTVLIVSRLAHGTKRHGELRREVGGISQKVLTQTLRALEREGLVARTVHPVVPPMVEYALTGRGETVIEPLMGLIRWAEGIAGEEDASAGRQPAAPGPAPSPPPRSVTVEAASREVGVGVVGAAGGR